MPGKEEVMIWTGNIFTWLKLVCLVVDAKCTMATTNIKFELKPYQGNKLIKIHQQLNWSSDIHKINEIYFIMAY